MSELPPSSPACPRCSAPLAPTAAQGALCPRCLLAQGLAHSDPEPPQAPPELADLAPLFPELEIVELLGQGGMGAVYKARQRALGRWVALKILVPRPGDEAGFAARFEREAHALARLAHPNVVGIHDSGRTQGRCWLLMEYVEGASLRQLLRTGELDVPRALAIVRQICDALEFAHEQGIVHRDIKPENVLVDTKGRVKIADFGLAKIVGQAQPGEPITRTQQSLGTPQYMAPEQLTGSPNVDHRADIYSLGVVFYELLTGELPLGRFEPPSQRVEVDVRLDEVVLRALERAPERRYQHATEMKTGIDGLGQPAAARVPALAWLLLFWPAELILRLVPRALALEPAREEQLLLGFSALVLALLGACAWFFRRDRRGAALRYALGSSVALGALACLLLTRDAFPGLFGLMQVERRPVDTWIVRGLLVLVGFEGFRLARGGRADLARQQPGSTARRGADLGVLLGSALVVLAALFEATWPYAAVLLCLVVLLADRSNRRAEQAPRPLRTLFGRILLPLLVAISAWIMPLYTHGWGWFGVVASSLVLALAVAGYLQQSVPDELREELRSGPAALRLVRALAAFVLLSIGALAVGASLLEHSPAQAQVPAEPSSERLAQLSGLVAANAQEGIDPLHRLPERVRGSRLDKRVLAPGAPAVRSAGWSENDGHGVLLILAAPLLLVWTRRWGWSWIGCWRYGLEVLAIVLLGLACSLPVSTVLLARAPIHEFRPLVVQASLPQGIELSRANLELALGGEGFAPHAQATRTWSDADGPVLSIDALSATAEPLLGRFRAWPAPPGSRSAVLAIELAGDAGHWASAIRIDAGPVRADQREQWQAMLTRIIQHTRAN